MTNCHTSEFALGFGKFHTRGFWRVFWKTASLLAFLLFTIPDAWAQDIVPEFFVDIVSARSDESQDVSRVDVYAQIGYSRLNFINTANGFSSSYEVSFDAIELSDNDRLRNVVLSRTWDGNVVVDTYSRTQSDDQADFTTQSFELKPGRYVFEFELIDKNSNQAYVREVPATVRSFNATTAISDLTLLESYDAETFAIIPLVDQQISTSDAGFQVFYEVYSEMAQDVTIRREVFRTLKNSVVALPMSWTGSRVEEADKSVFQEEELTPVPAGKSQHLVTIPVDDLKAGVYIVRISLLGSDGESLDAAEKSFLAHWTGLLAHIKDIDDAIQQLENYAKRKELNFILDAPNRVQKMERFQNFWDKRDPTPNTKRNEKMEEYYYRVAAANRQYSAVQEGWKTDRGFVFIRYGEPDFIERKPHSFNYEPYEIWIYERIGRQFIFIDKTGFGDFELLVPVWDERTRLY
ncbi:MAG: hypothetical protein BMS9Abin05_1105 [Rhodothermia bacterium]|nr:MAG: hypothetical protein BMS9Abin05_1105 [Rhodothermia bacterium]